MYTRVCCWVSVLLCVRVEGVCVCLLLDVAVSTAWLVSVLLSVLVKCFGFGDFLMKLKCW